MPDISLFGWPLWLIFLVGGVIYAAVLGALIAFDEWRGNYWESQEIRRRQAPVTVAGLGLIGLYLVGEIIAALARLGS
ncbi:hypothetical protein [Kitasatospora sp. NPDC004272]